MGLLAVEVETAGMALDGRVLGYLGERRFGLICLVESAGKRGDGGREIVHREGAFAEQAGGDELRGSVFSIDIEGMEVVEEVVDEWGCF